MARTIGMGSVSGRSPARRKRERPRARHGCQNCRLRHLKCDDQEASCQSCAAEGKECVRQPPAKFRHGWNPAVRSNTGSRFPFSFDANQPWCRTHHPLTFVDENRGVLSLYDDVPGEYGYGDAAEEYRESEKQYDDQEGRDDVVDRARGGRDRDDRDDRDDEDDEDDRYHGYSLSSQQPTTVAVPTSLSLTTRVCQDSLYGQPHTESLEPPSSVSPTSPLPSTSSSLVLVSSLPASTANGAFPRSLSPPHPHPSPSGSSIAAHHGIGISTLISPPERPPVRAVEHEPCEHYGRHERLAHRPAHDLYARHKLVVEPSLWPVQDRLEAYLLRHFIESVSPWYDLCDPERTFASVVPCRAVRYAPLMYAMCANSARYLSRTSGFDPNVAYRYYQRALATIRPMLTDETALVDENLFAATVILRNLEEMESPLSGDAHLLGNNLFAKATAALHDAAGPSGTILFTSVHRAAYIVAVRQEIQTAFVSQRSVSAHFSAFIVDMDLDVACSDRDWANRSVFLLADVLRFCYGQDGEAEQDDDDDDDDEGDGEQSMGKQRRRRRKRDPRTHEDVLREFDRLEAYSHGWHAKKPLSLSPIYTADGADGADAADGVDGADTVDTAGPWTETLSSDLSSFFPGTAPSSSSASAFPGRAVSTTLSSSSSTSPSPFFPDIWLISDMATTAMQHYHLSRVLLLAFDPRTPRLGPGRAAFLRRQDRAIREHVRILAGVATSNRRCVPNFLSAYMGITVAGERFDDRWEQEQIMGFLEEMETSGAWQTQDARERLSEAWGWDTAARTASQRERR